MSVVWHDLECGGYAADLPLWRALADGRGDPVLDLGAGAGRVSLDLARHGYRVTALDRDAELLAELARRAALARREGAAEVQTVLADAREFALGASFPLCVMPMQTVQLLGGAAERARFLACAHRHLLDGGLLAIALAEELEFYDLADGPPFALPDVCELDGVVYSSLPTAVRAEGDTVVLERRRETVARDGRRTVEHDLIALDRLSAGGLEREALAVGFRAAGRQLVAPTADHSGSTVVMLRA